MKICCISCGKLAIIIDHKFQTIDLMGTDIKVVDLEIECMSCEDTLSQTLRTVLEEDAILAHPRHYTQVTICVPPA